MVHQLSLQRGASEKEEEAYRILDEKISRYTLTGRFQPKETVLYRNTSYFIEWKEQGDDYEVCILIRNSAWVKSKSSFERRFFERNMATVCPDIQLPYCVQKSDAQTNSYF